MIHFKLVSLTGIKYDEDVYEVLLPTLDGEIGVLQGHMPLISVAKTGVIAIRRQAKDADSARALQISRADAVARERDSGSPR